MLTTGNQLKAARALAGLEQKDIADDAQVHVNTIRSMEAAGAGPISGRAQNVQAVQRTLESYGIEFLNHGKPGARLTSPVTCGLMSLAHYLKTNAGRALIIDGRLPSDGRKAEIRQNIISVSETLAGLARESMTRQIDFSEVDEALSQLIENPISNAKVAELIIAFQRAT